MNEYDITIRIDEYGLHLCHERTVKQNFGWGEVYYNEQFESVPVDLNRNEHKMIYRFRLECPATAHIPTNPARLNLLGT